MKKNIREWKPFTDYDTPCFVLYGGELAIYVPKLSDEPLRVKEEDNGNNPV
jgi:hypothetical protein